eukprot:comp24160_c1_seq1/m.44023 comp24160_c1_seq1/g.44023  ORF comp24160_c1_seq1/g.44023 comp24160_c1_seq1/m.44023 type:complete len:175 (-) comp24160_c1_seq1:224-748(-)
MLHTFECGLRDPMAHNLKSATQISWSAVKYGADMPDYEGGARPSEISKYAKTWEKICKVREKAVLSLSADEQDEKGDDKPSTKQSTAKDDTGEVSDDTGMAADEMENSGSKKRPKSDDDLSDASAGRPMKKGKKAQGVASSGVGGDDIVHGSPVSRDRAGGSDEQEGVAQAGGG